MNILSVLLAKQNPALSNGWPRCGARLVLLLALLLVTAQGVGAAEEDAKLKLEVPKTPVSAYDFTATLLNGEKVRISDYAGKIVFLNFWATWCKPCVEELPSMERLAQKMDGQPFAVVAVNMMESAALVKPFVDKLKLSYDVVLDELGEIGANYAAHSLPLTYIIDKQGRIIRRAVGTRPWDAKEMIAFFRRLGKE